jgi:hypothetical protein
VLLDDRDEVAEQLAFVGGQLLGDRVGGDGRGALAVAL